MALETSLNAVNGGQITMSTSFTFASSILSPRTRSSDSATVLFIFQFPAMINFRSLFIGTRKTLPQRSQRHAKRRRDETRNKRHKQQAFLCVALRLSAISAVKNQIFHWPLSVNAATPGSSLPSRNSRLAPPPVLMKVTCLPSLALFSAFTLSPPPMMLFAPFFCVASATARATANVPSAKRLSSNNPIGPFQRIVFAFATSSEYSFTVAGPLSTPAALSGQSSAVFVRTFW